MYGKTFQQQGEMTAVVCLCRDYHFIAENREERTISIWQTKCRWARVAHFKCFPTFHCYPGIFLFRLMRWFGKSKTDHSNFVFCSPEKLKMGRPSGQKFSLGTKKLNLRDKNKSCTLPRDTKMFLFPLKDKQNWKQIEQLKKRSKKFIGQGIKMPVNDENRRDGTVQSAQVGTLSFQVGTGPFGLNLAKLLGLGPIFLMEHVVLSW